MNKTRILFSAVLVLLVFSLALPPALAAGATEVYLNNAVLNAATPYWKNGSASAVSWLPDDEWNAYFNAATATVTLKNAVIQTNTLYNTYSGDNALLYADGDLTVVLTGDSRLQYTNTATTGYVYGIFSTASLTVTGSGSVDIQLQNLSSPNYTRAVAGEWALLIQSGRIRINVEGSTYVYGFYSFGNILFAGGEAAVMSTGPNARIVYTDGVYFRMTGGSLNGIAESTGNDARGVYAVEAYLEGGTGIFRATGPGRTRGMLLADGPLYVTGGSFRFMGDWEAICINQQPYVINIAGGIPVYVSEYASGADMRRWTSSADGILAGDVYLSKTSTFRFVQFGEFPETPQTGDSSAPWLWSGIGAACLLLAAGAVLAMRRKRR